MEREFRAVTDAVQFSKGGNAFLKHAVAALLIDVFRRVAGQGSDDLGLVLGQVFRQPVIAFRFNDGQVVPINDFRAGRARCFDEVAKELAQLRGAASQVHNFRMMLNNPVADAVGRRFVHHLRPPRRGIDVAMAAGLIALPPDVDLPRLQTRSTQGQVVLRQRLFKAIHQCRS